VSYPLVKAGHLLIDDATRISDRQKAFLFFLQCKMSIMARSVSSLRRNHTSEVGGEADTPSQLNRRI
jgi:hypothetical protein